MESNNNLLESKILEISNGDVVKKKKNYYMPVFLMILGLCLVMFNVQSQSVEADKINTVLFFVGAIAFVAGAAFMFLQKEQYLHKPSGKILKKDQVYFNVNDLDKLKRLYAEEKFDEMANLKKGIDSGCMITFIGSVDAGVYYSQLLKYEPYTFVPCSDAVRHSGETNSKIKVLIDAKC